jgi:hypothetical protein
MVAPPIGERASACVAAAARTRARTMRGRFVISVDLLVTLLLLGRVLADARHPDEQYGDFVVRRFTSE